MIMKKFHLSLLTLMLLGILGACNPIAYLTQDPFYQDNGESSFGSFPLIKPYKAINADKEFGWYIDLHVDPSMKELYYYNSLRNIEKIAVENGVIMVYTPYIKSVNKEFGEKVMHWFVIVPDQNIETGFDVESDFLNYIQKFDIKQPNWINPSSAFEQFDRTWCLDWIPACK